MFNFKSFVFIFAFMFAATSLVYSMFFSEIVEKSNNFSCKVFCSDKHTVTCTGDVTSESFIENGDEGCICDKGTTNEVIVRCSDKKKKTDANTNTSNSNIDQSNTKNTNKKKAKEKKNRNSNQNNNQD